VVNTKYIKREMSLVDRVFQIRQTCGTNDAVVHVPAITPINSEFMEYPPLVLDHYANRVSLKIWLVFRPLVRLLLALVRSVAKVTKDAAPNLS
jgi:hypothetical protein